MHRNKLKKLSKVDQAFVRQSEAWLRTQKTSIESCALGIKHSTELIEINKRAIALDKKEMRAKQRTYDLMKQKLAQFIKERSA